jgi:hypothetical protein
MFVSFLNLPLVAKIKSLYIVVTYLNRYVFFLYMAKVIESGRYAPDPNDLIYDNDFIATIREKKQNIDEQALKGLISPFKLRKIRNKRNQIKNISMQYAILSERDDPNDNKTLAERVDRAWDAISGADSQFFTHADIINCGRNLTYIWEQRDPNRYRTTDLFAKRLCNNEDYIYSIMTNMLEFAKEIDDPIRRALYLHLSIVYLQPGQNGNKRLAQLISGKVLFDNGYPLPFVPPEEFNYYSNAMWKAAIKLDQGDPKRASPEVFHYLLSRLSTSLDILRESCCVR